VNHRKANPWRFTKSLPVRAECHNKRAIRGDEKILLNSEIFMLQEF
jgi:hypothetical protein